MNGFYKSLLALVVVLFLSLQTQGAGDDCLWPRFCATKNRLPGEGGCGLPQCVAGDVQIAELYATGADGKQLPTIRCDKGDILNFYVAARTVANSNERYDIGYWIGQAGSRADSGPVCYNDYLASASPCGECENSAAVPATQCGTLAMGTECFGPKAQCTPAAGGVDLLTGFGPFFNGEGATTKTPSQRDCADLCGDLAQGVDSIYRMAEQIDILCADSSGNGVVDLHGCTSWDNGSRQTCINEEDTAPNTASKCRCEYIDVTNIVICLASPPQVNCAPFVWNAYIKITGSTESLVAGNNAIVYGHMYYDFTEWRVATEYFNPNTGTWGARTGLTRVDFQNPCKFTRSSACPGAEPGACTALLDNSFPYFCRNGSEIAIPAGVPNPTNGVCTDNFYYPSDYGDIHNVKYLWGKTVGGAWEPCAAELYDGTKFSFYENAGTTFGVNVNASPDTLPLLPGGSGTVNWSTWNATCTTQPAKCSATVDIAFVVDEQSPAVGNNNDDPEWSHFIDFIYDKLINTFFEQGGFTRFGFTWSCNSLSCAAGVHSPSTFQTSHSSINTAVNGRTKQGGTTAWCPTVRAALAKWFPGAPTVQRRMVVIMGGPDDGTSDAACWAAYQAERDASGVRVYVYGIGAEGSASQLNTIKSNIASNSRDIWNYPLSSQLLNDAPFLWPLLCPQTQALCPACNSFCGCSGNCVCPSCDNSDVCNPSSCSDPATGCVPNPFLCAAGDFCTGCQAVGGVATCADLSSRCNDQNDCTADQCDEAGNACIYTPRSCNDDKACTVDTCVSNNDGVFNAADCVYTPNCNDPSCRPDSCVPNAQTGAIGSCLPDPNDACKVPVCTEGAFDCNTFTYPETCSFTPLVLPNCEPVSNGCQQRGCQSINGVATCVDQPTNCNDNDVCTVDSCDSSKTPPCVYTPIVCSDGNACTADICDVNNLDSNGLGKCAYNPITCDDSDPCTRDTCDTANGCVYTPITCSDGSKCTTDYCDATNLDSEGLGTCKFVPVTCDDSDACTKNECSPGSGCFYTPITCDDQNVCTSDYCNQADGKCVFTPIVGKCNDMDDCTTDRCDSKSGCSYTPITCDDFDVCTTNVCNPSGGCAYNPITCDDGDTCTTAGCDPQTGCFFTPITCSDGAKCTTDACVGGSCVYTPVTCTPTDPCTTPSCDPESGNCVFTPIVCNDDNTCTTDACVAGSCVYTPVTCNDMDLCTTDRCELSTGKCVYTPVDCNDGSGCTNDFCNANNGTCSNVVFTTDCCVSLNCDDMDACTDDVCKVISMVETCFYTPIAVTDPRVCGQGSDLCTTRFCETVGGNPSCGSTPVGGCNDNNVCTTEECVDGAVGCVYTPVTCSDGNVCTDDVCVAPSTGCTFTPITCNDMDPCTTDKCVGPSTGCVFTPIICNDNTVCTTDACVGGSCVYTPITPCDDADLCTTDRCDDNAGCIFTPITCNDGDACTTDYCDQTNGKCVFAPLQCDDTDECTTDRCNPTSGTCQYTPITCDDNNVCTTNSCNPASGCVYTPSGCSDGDTCTTDTCVAEGDTGCVFTPITCNDGQACTDDSCQGGTCVYAPRSCNDGDTCTTDECNPGDGTCKFTPIVCEDFAFSAALNRNVPNVCTTDACVGGSCVFTPITCATADQCATASCDPVAGCIYTPTTCDDNNQCTDDSCNPTTGQCGYVFNCTRCPPADPCLQASTCDDSNACTEDRCTSAINFNDCTRPAQCTYSPITVCTDDMNACTTCSCDTTTGQAVVSAVTCDDGNSCTNDVCDPATGTCSYTPVVCQNNNKCRVRECVNGKCEFTATIQCNDNSNCTMDRCDPTSGCVYEPIVCEPGTPCSIVVGCFNGTDFTNTSQYEGKFGCQEVIAQELIDFCGLCLGDNVGCFFEQTQTFGAAEAIGIGAAIGIAAAAAVVVAAAIFGGKKGYDAYQAESAGRAGKAMESGMFKNNEFMGEAPEGVTLGGN